VSSVLVLGAAGRTGRLVVTRALALGHDVTAGVRTPEAFASAELPEGAGRLAVARVDVRDQESVRAAAAGHDGIVSAVGPTGRRADGLYSATADAVVATGVRRVIVMTSAGVRHDDPGFALWYRVAARALLRELYGDMRRMEELLAAADVERIVVRPSRIHDGARPAGVRVEDGAVPAGGARVHRQDLAEFIARQVDDGRWIGASPTLAE
jgi:uncharacterized protein YbjT (DUF2867 family)